MRAFWRGGRGGPGAALLRLWSVVRFAFVSGSHAMRGMRDRLAVALWGAGARGGGAPLLLKPPRPSSKTVRFYINLSVNRPQGREHYALRHYLATRKVRVCGSWGSRTAAEQGQE